MDGKGGSGSQRVDAYLAQLPPKYRVVMERLRKTIRAAAPEAEEVISYRMPAFRQNGALVFYAAFTDHCSLFLGSVRTQRKFAAELKSFAAGKGTIHFTPERPLPPALVARMVKARVAENEARSKARARTSGTGSRKSSRSRGGKP